MLDIRRIRTEPDAIKANLAKRGEDTSKIDALLALDEIRREKQTEWEVLRAEQNKLGPQIAAAKKAGEDATAVLAHLGELKSRLQSLDETLKSLDPEQEALLSKLPNLVLDDVPEGGEECNAEIRGANKPLREFDFEPKAHWDLGAALGLFDTERGAKLSGSGFVLYTGVGARLQRALINLISICTPRFMATPSWASRIYSPASLLPPRGISSSSPPRCTTMLRATSSLCPRRSPHWSMCTGESC